MRIGDFRAVSIRGWILAAAAAVGAVWLAVGGVWVVRYAWAIQKLNRGVGDTTFYDAAGHPWFRLDDERRDVPFDRIATSFKDAVIASEDHRYYLHPGLDPIGLTRALFHNLRSDEGSQGGSTITQQLARTLFLTNARTYGRKLREAALAVMIEALLTKKEILELYMNRVYLGGGIYGVENMSRRALGKPASDLSVAEAAFIAGIIRAPAVYSPWTHFDRARSRSLIVLQRMREEGKITVEQEQAARVERIAIRKQGATPSARHGYAKEYLRQQFRGLYGEENPPDWKVYTTLVPEFQDAAEAAVARGLRRLGAPGLQAALVALDPETGNLLALVGGADFAASPFNRAVRGRRQPGSAFKPFVYAAALAQGSSPVSSIDGLQNVAVQAPEGVWIPNDERKRLHDTLTFRDALVESNNAAAVLLQQRIGTRPVLQLAEELGVTDQPAVPSLALGSGLVTPLDLTAAYAVFPNGGFRVRPRGIVSIADADNNGIHYVHVEREPVLPPEVAFQMVSILRDVIDRGTGSSARAAGLPGAVGGKTGTTNDYRDAWFVGFSSSVVVGVWVGFDQGQPIGGGASGARAAVPIWADFMRQTARTLPARAFRAPAGLRRETLCRISHERPVDGCPTYVEYFKEGDDVPARLCAIHRGSLSERAQQALAEAFESLGRRLADVFR